MRSDLGSIFWAFFGVVFEPILRPKNRKGKKWSFSGFSILLKFLFIFLPFFQFLTKVKKRNIEQAKFSVFFNFHFFSLFFQLFEFLGFPKIRVISRQVKMGQILKEKNGGKNGSKIRPIFKTSNSSKK